MAPVVWTPPPPVSDRRIESGVFFFRHFIVHYAKFKIQHTTVIRDRSYNVSGTSVSDRIMFRKTLRTASAKLLLPPKPPPGQSTPGDTLGNRSRADYKFYSCKRPASGKLVRERLSRRRAFKGQKKKKKEQQST